MDTPVLLIVWRRPHTLLQVINAIRPVAPKRLFVACDGPDPERPGEAEKVSATRALIETEIDWPCEIERLYSNDNQGCRVGPIRAITWFFERVEEGVILEDDCVPHFDFFPFCANLLDRYRYDTRVWCISGNNYQRGIWRGDGSYYFGLIPLTWGWATWRRAWQPYDPDLKRWPAFRDSGLLEGIIQDSVEKEYWSSIWNKTFQKSEPVTWWDYQWQFNCLVNSGLTIFPNRNLVSNVGFGPDGTHTTFFAQPTTVDQGLGVLCHPQFVVRDVAADSNCFDNHFGGAEIRKRFKTLSNLKIRMSTAFRDPLYYPKKILGLPGFLK